MVNPSGFPTGTSVYSPTGGPVSIDGPIKAAAPTTAAAAGAGLLAYMPFIGAGLNFAANMYGASKQAGYNKELAAFQHEKNMELLKYQLEYNTPKSQMARFAEAGLNPNLIYGQGSPGNMESAPRYPDIQAANYQSAYADIGLKAAQARLLDSQADLNDQKLLETQAKTDVAKSQVTLNQAKEEVTRANPFLDKTFTQAFVNRMEQLASQAESKARLDYYQANVGEVGTDGSYGERKIRLELQQLEQKYKLSEQDLKIKAEIFQSQQFQNDLKEIEVKFMKDGTMTSQHWIDFAKLLLSRIGR